jgi:HNH endonuclease
MSPRAVSAALRQRVAEAARFRCGYCLASQRIIGPLLEIDHIIPEARGGTSDEENLWLACPICNGRKADRQEALDPESRAMVPLFNPRFILVSLFMTRVAFCKVNANNTHSFKIVTVPLHLCGMKPTDPNPSILHQLAHRSFTLTPFPNRSTLAPTRVRAWSLRERGGLL